MTATLRERAEHAAKYGSNLVVPARELLALLARADAANGDALAAQWQAEAEPWREQAEWLSARLHAVHELHPRRRRELRPLHPRPPLPHPGTVRHGDRARRGR